MAQFIHRSGAWQVRIPLGRNPLTGKRKYHSHTVHGTKKDAQRYATGQQRLIDLGQFAEPTRVTIGEFLDQWLVGAGGRVRERTKYEYERLLERYARGRIGGARLADVTPLHVQGIYAAMLKRGLSGRTVRYTHAVVSSAFKQAVKWRMIPIEESSASRHTERAFSYGRLHSLFGRGNGHVAGRAGAPGRTRRGRSPR